MSGLVAKVLLVLVNIKARAFVDVIAAKAVLSPPSRPRC